MTDQQPRSAESGRNGPSAALIGFVVVAALFVLFFLQNGGDVKIQFLTFKEETTVRWSIIVAVVLGVLLDRLFGIWWRRRQRKKFVRD